MLELWGMQSTPSLPLLPGPLWPGVVAPDRVEFMGQIELLYPDIGLAVRVFANGPGDLGSVPGRVIPKTQKMVLDASLLNTQHYKVRIKGKVEQSREGVAPSPTPWCSSYRKGSLRVTLDYGRQLYFFTLELLFKIKLFICIKMDLALYNLQRLICHKPLTNKFSMYCSWWIIVI